MDRPKRVEGIPAGAYDDYFMTGLDAHFVSQEYGFLGVRYLYGPSASASFLQSGIWQNGLMQRHSIGFDMGVRIGAQNISLVPHFLIGGNFAFAQGPAGETIFNTGFMEFGLEARYFLSNSLRIKIYTGVQLSFSDFSSEGTNNFASNYSPAISSSWQEGFSATPRASDLLISASVDFPVYIFK